MTPGINNGNDSQASYKDQLINQIESVKKWDQLSGLIREEAIEEFMRNIGLLYIEYFQTHLEEANRCALPHKDHLEKAVRPIEMFYIRNVMSYLNNFDAYDDPWEKACWARTNVEAFNSIFGGITRNLDADEMIEFMEGSRGLYSLDKELIPKNAPQTHWWWFENFGI